MRILAQWKSSRETEKGQGRVRVKKRGVRKGACAIAYRVTQSLSHLLLLLSMETHPTFSLVFVDDRTSRA